MPPRQNPTHMMQAALAVAHLLDLAQIQYVFDTVRTLLDVARAKSLGYTHRSQVTDNPLLREKQRTQLLDLASKPMMVGWSVSPRARSGPFLLQCQCSLTHIRLQQPERQRHVHRPRRVFGDGREIHPPEAGTRGPREVPVGMDLGDEHARRTNSVYRFRKFWKTKCNEYRDATAAKASTGAVQEVMRLRLHFITASSEPRRADPESRGR